MIYLICGESSTLQLISYFSVGNSIFYLMTIGIFLRSSAPGSENANIFLGHESFSCGKMIRVVATMWHILHYTCLWTDNASIFQEYPARRFLGFRYTQSLPCHIHITERRLESLLEKALLSRSMSQEDKQRL